MPSPIPVNSLAYCQNLLAERGYVNGEFGTPSRLGMWLQEWEQQYTLVQTQAHGDGVKRSLYLETTGKFNNHLDTVQFRFKFQYYPKSQQLILTRLLAYMRGARKSFFLHQPDDLPKSETVYLQLAARHAQLAAQRRVPAKEVKKRTIILTTNRSRPHF